MTDDDRGSATVWTVSLLLVLVVIGTAALTAAGVLVAHARAVTAADLAALAGAAAIQSGASEATACEQARRIAVDNGAQSLSCVVSGDVVDFVAEVPIRGATSLVGPARAAGRAGPTGQPGGHPLGEP